MPYIRESDLVGHIKKAEFSSVYFFYGDETFLCQNYAQKIALKITEGGFEDFNLFKFNGNECGVNEIVNAAEQAPVMADKKCVVVCDFNVENVSGGDLEKMKKLLKNPPEFSVIIFWFDSVAVNPKKSAKWKSFVSLAAGSGDAVELNRLEEHKLHKIINDSCVKRNCKIYDNAIRRLIELSGNSLQNLQLELDKLSAFKEKGEITIEDVEALAVKSLDSTSFDFVKAIVSQNGRRAFLLLDELFSQRAEPVAILGALIMGYVDMYRAKLAVISGKKAEEAAKYYDYKNKEFRLKNADRTARDLSTEQLQACLEILNRADCNIKYSALDNRIVLEKTVAELLGVLSKR